MRILAVDDNTIALTVLKHALVQAGHEVESAANGREAMEILRAFMPACHFRLGDAGDEWN